MDIPKYYIGDIENLRMGMKKYPESIGDNTQNANYISKISTKTDLQLHKPTRIYHQYGHFNEWATRRLR